MFAGAENEQGEPARFAFPQVHMWRAVTSNRREQQKYLSRPNSKKGNQTNGIFYSEYYRIAGATRSWLKRTGTDGNGIRYP